MTSTAQWCLIFMLSMNVFLPHASVKASRVADFFQLSGPLVKSSEGVTLRNDQISVTLGIGSGRRGFQGSIQSLVYKPGNGAQDIELLQRKSEKANHFPAYWDMHWYDESHHSRSGDVNRKCIFGDVSKTTWSETHSKEKAFKDQMIGVTFGEEGKRTATKSASAAAVDTIVHYSVKNDTAGVYCSLLVDHNRSDPAMLLDELRLVLMLNPNLFDYEYVADDRQKLMPSRKDISRHSSSKLDFKEARLITRPEDMSHYQEVDHKYIHSVETKDSSLYGWISKELSGGMRVGVWMISPNKWEYMGGGPTKQDLSVQTGPKLLAMLHSRHYGTPSIELERGEEWKKVFGPFLIYVNYGSSREELVLDAKARAAEEALSWPYQWVPFLGYQTRESRGLVVGRVTVQEPSNVDQNITTLPGGKIWIGLVDQASLTNNWEDEVKNYQYWNTTNEQGEFTIYNVRPGKYVLHSIVHGDMIDTSVLRTVTVEENFVSDMRDIILQPLQKGPIVWEIGYPDRSAAEFMIPAELSKSDHDSSSCHNNFRQYGLWEKFEELYPDRDPVFKIGESDWAKDWYFAHVLRSGNRPTQREILFSIDDAVVEGNYTLRIAVAGAHQAALEIRVNNPDDSPLIDTVPFGKDNALARAGIHGHYYEFSFSLSHINFRKGENSIFLRQRRNESKFNYVMYDYLRLEAPARPTHNLSAKE